MKTYAETSGEQPFDWNQWLDDVIYGKWEFTSDIQEKRHMALSWVMCACGNQCRDIPRRPGGEPCDRKLFDLGCAFAYAIDNSLFQRAKSTLAEIEARSSFLLAKMETAKSAG